MAGVALSVNLNKIALIRNSREGSAPDPNVFARIALDAGAKGITVHPRPDERHIRADDLVALVQICREMGAEFNIEGNPFVEAGQTYPGFMSLAQTIRPQQCTLVPDAPQQRTSEHGFEPSEHNASRLQPLIKQLHAWGCRVSLFSEPNDEAPDFAMSVGAECMELHTGAYAHADADKLVLQHYVRVAKKAQRIGIDVNAGHDLNLNNLRPFVDAVRGLREVSIGHALITDALHMGMNAAVRAYLKCLA